MRKAVRTPRQDRIFLAALASGDTIGRAAARARYGVSTLNTWRNEDPAFAAQWQQALDAQAGRRDAQADTQHRAADMIARLTALATTSPHHPRDAEARFLAVLFSGLDADAPTQSDHDKAQREIMVAAMHDLIWFTGLRVIFSDPNPQLARHTQLRDDVLERAAVLATALGHNGITFSLERIGR